MSRKKKMDSMDSYVDEMSEKRASTRENALSSVIGRLTSNLEQKFVEKNFATLLYRFLHFVKKGSAKEIHLACHAIGLLAMIIDSRDYSHELYEEAIPGLCEALRKSKPNIPMVLQCMAITTFFCADNSEETERTMQIIWKFIHPESGSDVSKHPGSVISAAISAWSFLLTSVDGWRLNCKYWLGAIPYFSNILEGSDESVCISVGEALALIYEMESIEKFSSEANGCTSISTQEGSESSQTHFIKKEVMKDDVLKRLDKCTSNGRDVCNADWDVLKFFRDGNFPQTSITVGGNGIRVSSWSLNIQVNFIRRFLGKNGFVKHMLENEHLQNVFEFQPKKKISSGPELYESTPCEAVVRLYLPKEKDATYITRSQIKRERALKNYVIDKAQTQLLNKQRKFAERRKNDYFTAED